MFQLPPWLNNWLNLIAWRDLLFTFAALILITLLMIWWSQQTPYWYRIAGGTFLAGFLLCIASFYLFEVPPYYAGCPGGCPGWRGYPRAVATIDVHGIPHFGLANFGLNLL